MLSPIFRLLFATGQPSIERAYSPPHNLVAVAIAATSTVLDAAASAAFFCIFISLFTYVRAFADIFYVLVADLKNSPFHLNIRTHTLAQQTHSYQF